MCSLKNAIRDRDHGHDHDERAPIERVPIHGLPRSRDPSMPTTHPRSRSRSAKSVDCPCRGSVQKSSKPLRPRPGYAAVARHDPARRHDPGQWNYPRPFDHGVHCAAAAMVRHLGRRGWVTFSITFFVLFIGDVCRSRSSCSFRPAKNFICSSFN